MRGSLLRGLLEGEGLAFVLKVKRLGENTHQQHRENPRCVSRIHHRRNPDHWRLLGDCQRHFHAASLGQAFGGISLVATGLLLTQGPRRRPRRTRHYLFPSLEPEAAVSCWEEFEPRDQEWMAVEVRNSNVSCLRHSPNLALAFVVDGFG